MLRGLKESSTARTRNHAGLADWLKEGIPALLLQLQQGEEPQLALKFSKVGARNIESHFQCPGMARLRRQPRSSRALDAATRTRCLPPLSVIGCGFAIEKILRIEYFPSIEFARRRVAGSIQ